MRNCNYLWMAVLGLCLCGAGCLRSPEEAPGGLAEGDFTQVALNGFDPADQAQDHNDYPWSMEFFKADGSAGEGHLYVGTWNRVQQYKGFQDHQPVYPEIRRYRPDLGPTQWETVLDTRDFDLSDADRPHGFRIMKTYRNQSDGKLFLYAGGRGDTTSIWRSETGEPGSWTQFWKANREGSIRGMTIHNGLLYLSFYNDYEMVSKADAAESLIFATDGTEVWDVLDNAFGNKRNVGIFTIESFNNWLYVGTHNPLQGAELWKMEGPDPTAAPVQIMKHGGPRWMNESVLTMQVWNDHLYIGTQASFLGRMIGGLHPADLLRLDKEDHLEVVVGPHSIGGEKSGFGEGGNAYMWSMCAHDGWFYVGTYDIVPGLTYMLTHPRYILGMMGIGKKATSEAKCLTMIDLIRLRPNKGGDLYKTQDGKTWYCVMTDGMGNPNSYGVRTMASANGRLFLGMANPYEGLEVWASTMGDK